MKLVNKERELHPARPLQDLVKDDSVHAIVSRNGMHYGLDWRLGEKDTPTRKALRLIMEQKSTND